MKERSGKLFQSMTVCEIVCLIEIHWHGCIEEQKEEEENKNLDRISFNVFGLRSV